MLSLSEREKERCEASVTQCRSVQCSVCVCMYVCFGWWQQYVKLAIYVEVSQRLHLYKGDKSDVAHRKSQFLTPPFHAQKQNLKKKKTLSLSKSLTAACLEKSLVYSNGLKGQPHYQTTTLDCLKQGLIAAVFYIYMYIRACLQAHVCMCWHGGGTEGIRGHVWGTCCGNRYMCGFIEGEVKAEGRSCLCLEGLIYAYNKRKEVKSRNWPGATVI